MIQAKILVIQVSNRGARTRSHTAVSFSMHRTHCPPTQRFRSMADCILPQLFHINIRCVMRRRRFHRQL
jgi:hypothetical protein